MHKIQDFGGLFDETTLEMCGDAIVDLNIGAALDEHRQKQAMAPWCVGRGQHLGRLGFGSDRRPGLHRFRHPHRGRCPCHRPHMDRAWLPPPSRLHRRTSVLFEYARIGTAQVASERIMSPQHCVDRHGNTLYVGDEDAPMEWGDARA